VIGDSPQIFCFEEQAHESMVYFSSISFNNHRPMEQIGSNDCLNKSRLLGKRHHQRNKKDDVEENDWTKN
jgi:hypothetical protein